MSSQPIESQVPEYIRQIHAYEPGRPIEEVERELGIRAIKLASNENPLGPSPMAVEALRRAATDSNWYPDGAGFYLRKKLSERLNVPMESLILGAGTCELIDLAARTLLAHGDNAVTSEGSFPLYYTAVQATGEELVCIRMRQSGFDLDAIARAVNERTKLVYLANPNNPTGTMFTADDLDVFLGGIPEKTLVVLDEAYYEYADRPGYSRSLELVRKGRNVLVLRTFSKIYGLAGLRVGYAAGPAALLAQMHKVRQPFNVSGVSLAAAFAALDDVEHVRHSLENNRRGLAQIQAALLAQGVEFVPSCANFVLAHLGPETNRIAQEMLRLGVIVRPHDENEKFLAALAECRGAGVQRPR
jgi:histidinol-phosphate aminotransferase